MKLKDYVKLDSAMDTIEQYDTTAKYGDLTQIELERIRKC